MVLCCVIHPSRLWKELGKTTINHKSCWALFFERQSKYQIGGLYQLYNIRSYPVKIMKYLQYSTGDTPIIVGISSHTTAGESYQPRLQPPSYPLFIDKIFAFLMVNNPYFWWKSPEIGTQIMTKNKLVDDIPSISPGISTIYPSYTHLIPMIYPSPMGSGQQRLFLRSPGSGSPSSWRCDWNSQVPEDILCEIQTDMCVILHDVYICIYT